MNVVWTAVALLAVSGCSPVNGEVSAQNSARGSISALVGPLQIRGVSADPHGDDVYLSLCRGDACSIYLAGDGDRLVPVLEDSRWNYRWVAAEGDGRFLAVRTAPASETVPDPVSEIIRHRPGEAAPEVLRSEAGRVTSLHSLGGGAYAYFVSTGLRPVEGCGREDCRYVPVAQRLMIVDAEGGVVGTLDDVVDGLEGEAFHPWAEGLWLVMPHNSSRTRHLPATITAGPKPVLTPYSSLADAAAASPATGWPATPERFNMIAAPFRDLGVVAVSESVDLTAQDRAVLVQPAPGARPDRVEIRPVSRSESGWRAGRPRTYRF